MNAGNVQGSQLKMGELWCVMSILNRKRNTMHARISSHKLFLQQLFFYYFLWCEFSYIICHFYYYIDRYYFLRLTWTARQGCGIDSITAVAWLRVLLRVFGKVLVVYSLCSLATCVCLFPWIWKKSPGDVWLETFNSAKSHLIPTNRWFRKHH